MNPVVHFEIPAENRERMAGSTRKHFSFYDTEGNRGSMLQALPGMSTGPKSR